MKTVRKYGDPPYRTALLHGGPGAAGDLKPVAEYLSEFAGVAELLQTGNNIEELIGEVIRQLNSVCEIPVIICGHSWGAWLGFMIASRYPDLIKKLIMISAGSFDRDLNRDMMNIRLSRLNAEQREEVESIILRIAGKMTGPFEFSRFGELMTIADSYACLPFPDDPVRFNYQQYRIIWEEAEKMRDSGKLLAHYKYIRCPVVAIHGRSDPHPIDGVSIPLSGKLENFRMIALEKCGHTPWKEKFARKNFYNILKNEILY